MPGDFELKYHHGGLSVSNLAASVAWYRDVLGFEVEKYMDIRPLSAKAAMLQRGPLRVELFEVPGSAPVPEDRKDPHTDLMTQGTKHIAFAVQDADAVAEELARRGADVVCVMHHPFGSNTFIRDNSGNLIEFVQEPSLWDADHRS